MINTTNKPNTYLNGIPAVASVFEDADVIDIKSTEAPITLREFIAAFAGYRPFFMEWLFKIRNVFVTLLGIEKDTLAAPAHLRPEDVPMQPGGELLFIVKESQDNLYWIAGEDASHLNFDLAVVVEPLGATNRIYVITVVRYNKAVGRFYFRVIEPFHHLLVWLFMGAAVKSAPRQRIPQSA